MISEEMFKEACFTLKQCAQMRERLNILKKGEQCDYLKILNPTPGLVLAMEDVILSMFEQINNQKKTHEQL